MPAIFEAELKKHISSEKFSNVYLLYGDEKYLIKHYTNLIIKKAVATDFADFNLHIFDGKTADLDEVSAACESLPMFDKYNCILIKDLQADNLNADVADKLTTLISDLPETSLLIISATNIDLNMKSAKGKKILSVIDKFGSSVNFSHPDMRQLSSLIIKGAADRGCEFSPTQANYLVTLVGDDMTTVLNELEKICAYKKSGKILNEDIDAVVVKSMQARAFDLTKALVANNCDAAMSVLDTLMYMKEEPIAVLGAIITPYIDMYRAKVYASGGMRAEDAAKDFNYRNKEFRLTNAARSASKYSITQLREFLDILNEADSMLKSTSLDGRLILEQTITKLLLVSNGEKL